jgi:hypothetical protein
MIRRSALSSLVAATALSVSAFAFADAQGIPAPPGVAPPFTIPSAPAIPAPPSTATPPQGPTATTPTANPSPASPLPGTSNSGPGISMANGGVGPGMDSVPLPSGDSYFNGYSEDGYNRPDPTASGIWYADIYDQVYNSYYYFGELEKWAYANYYGKRHAGDSYDSYRDIYELYVYASYCRYYFQTYFWTYFSYNGSSVSPQIFDFAYEGQSHETFAWRGYFNYNYYYYIEPIYRAYLGKAATYYNNHHSDYNDEVSYNGQSYGKYSDVHSNMKGYFHGLENCEYGYMTTDTAGYHGSDLTSLEAAAGF